MSSRPSSYSLTDFFKSLTYFAFDGTTAACINGITHTLSYCGVRIGGILNDSATMAEGIQVSIERYPASKIVTEESFQERLRDHAKSFDGLLSLIPAKIYYGEDTSVGFSVQ